MEKIILSQKAFKFGIIYFIIFVLCSIIFNTIYPTQNSLDNFVKSYDSLIRDEIQISKNTNENLIDINTSLNNVIKDKLQNINDSLSQQQMIIEMENINKQISELRKSIIIFYEKIENISSQVD